MKRIRLSKCSIDNDEKTRLISALESEFLGHGSFVVEFENKISTYLGGADNVVCVNSGTAALHLALESLGLPRGSEVLVPTVTYVASYQAITAAGLNPISCDIDPSTLFISVADAEKRLTARTRCIMPVHHSGAAPNLSEVYKLAEREGLRVIEDAAQAFGSYNFLGEKVGSEAFDIICFSFDGIKNITCGEGGVIVSDNPSVINYCRDARFLGVEKDTIARNAGGRSWHFDVANQGYRYHMSNLNAAIGLAQIEKIDFFRERRQKIVKHYLEKLKGTVGIAPLDLDYSNICPHIFVLKCERRDELRTFLSERGIETGIHYYPNHMLSKYRDYGKFQNASSVFRSIISLPLHVDLDSADVDKVINSIFEFYDALSK